VASRAAHWLARTLPAAAWTVLLALSPWRAGLPLLLLMALGAVMFDRRIEVYATLCRRGLRWGLPGLLFAVQHALGGDLLAWGAALLGALVGFSLLALLESLLDHRVRRIPAGKVTPEWRELALAPIGPPVRIIELARAAWQDAGAGVVAGPDGAAVRYEAHGNGRGRYVFARDRSIDRAGPRCCFGPGGRWFAASHAGRRGTVLWDRKEERILRLAGWALSGWEGEQPWLARGSDGVPTSLHEVLGR